MHLVLRFKRFLPVYLVKKNVQKCLCKEAFENAEIFRAVMFYSRFDRFEPDLKKCFQLQDYCLLAQ